jgi:hypothetical protein
MIELYVLATLGAMGYLLNKASNTEVSAKPSTKLSVNEIPSQETVYESNNFQKAKEAEERKVKKMFEMAKNPKKNNVIDKNFALLNTGGQQALANADKIKSLSGEYIDNKQFTHNNMVPFFGGNVKQNMSEHANATLLESYTGTGQTFMNKQEVKSMYDTVKDVGFVNGMQNVDDFYRDRLVESKVRNNVLPMPQIKVGPGLNQGYDGRPTGGYQQLDVQELAMPNYKTADELRVANKPKLSYEGRVVDGLRGTVRAEVPNLAKNRVETFYEQTPDMLLKTTGAYIKPTEQPEFNVKITNRVEATREITGGAGSTVPARKLDEDSVKPTNRQQLKEFGLRNTALNAYGTGDGDDYGKSKILVYNNERDITTTRVYQGNVTSIIKAITAPLEDILRINKKEHAVDNARHFGNMSVQIPDKPTMYDPNDIARTTIKETLIHDDMGKGTVTGPKQLTVYDPEEIAKRTLRETLERMDYEMNVGTNVPRNVVYDPEDVTRTTMKETLVESARAAGNPNSLEGLGTYINEYLARNTQKQFTSDTDYYGGATRDKGEGHLTNKHIAPNTQKQFFSDNDYYGTAASAAKKDISKTDYENAVITERKEVTLYGREPTREGKKVITGGESVNFSIIKKAEIDMMARRDTHNMDRLNADIPSYTTLNVTKDKHFYNEPDDRLDPSLLKAFVENPYTQSLTSVV